MKQTIFLLFFVCFSLTASAEDNRTMVEDSVYQTGKKFDYFFLEALRLKEINKHSDAYTTLQFALKIDSTSSIAHALLANYYLFLQQDSLAVDAFQKAVKYDPQNFEYKVSLAEIYREMGNFAESTLLYESLVAEQPDKPELKFYLSDLYLRHQDKWEEARFQLQVVTEAEPENLLAWRVLTEIAIKEKNPDEIIRICNSVLTIFPENSEFYFYKGSAYYQLKNYQEALPVFLEGIQYIPAEEILLLSIFYGQIGDLYHQINKKEESYQAYDKSLEYNDNNIFVLNNYAYFLSLDKEQLDKAERMSGKCLKIQPNNPTYIDTYAWVFFQKGNYTLAKFYIESAISNGGEKSPDILEHYGDILFKTGNPDKAVEQWEKALKAKDTGENTVLLQKKIENKMYYETK